MDCYLQKRRGRWYFRIRVPKELHGCLHAEISYPIHGSDLTTALFRCKLLGERLKEIFEKAKNGIIGMGILNDFVREFCANILYSDASLMTSSTVPAADYERMRRFYQTCLERKYPYAAQDFISVAEHQGVTIDPDDPASLPIIMNYYQGLIETYRILIERASGNLRNGYDAPDASGHMSAELSKEDATISVPGVPPVILTAEELGRTSDIFERVSAEGNNPLPEDAPLRHTMSLSEKLAQLSRRRKNTATASSLSMPAGTPAPLPQQTQVLPSEVKQVLTLGEGIEKYMQEREVEGVLDIKALGTIRSMLSLLSESLCPERKLSEIKRDMIVKLLSDVLPKYPRHREKLYPGKSLPELLKMTPAPDPLSKKTQANYLSYWSTFFRWCVQCEYMSSDPAAGLKVRRKVHDKTEERPAFTTDELKQIFADIAAMPDRPHFQRKLYDFRFWVPLIALYQGMRLNEICQLFLDDVCVEDGLPCLRVRPDEGREQKVKNSSSIRTIPIHSVLLKLGFLDYVISRYKDKCRKNNQLFEELTRTIGGHQRKMQRFNVRIHKALKIDSRKTFHSFRHNFDTVLSNTEGNVFLIQCLDGHARQGELGSRYSKGNLKNMKDTLEKVVYDLDIFKIMKRKPLDSKTIDQQVAQLTKLSATSQA